MSQGKVLEKIFQANEPKKQAGVAILVPNKIDFKLKLITRVREGHYILIKRKIQEDISVLVIYTPNIKTPKFVSTTTA